MKPDKIIPVIAWSWLAWGALGALSGLAAFAASSDMPRLDDTFPVQSAPIEFLWANYRTCAFVQFLVSTVAVIAALSFLKRREWARLAIGALSVLHLAWAVTFYFLWAKVVLAVAPAPASGGSALLVIRILMLAMGGLVMLGFASAFGLCLWCTTRPELASRFRTAR